MTDKELRQMKRGTLLELLLEQAELNEKLKKELEETKAKLRERDIAVANAGTLAEAAISINGMLTAADNSAKQYLENIQAANGASEKILADARKEAEEIVRSARAEANELRRSALGMETGDSAELKQDLQKDINAAFERMKRRNRL